MRLTEYKHSRQQQQNNIPIALYKSRSNPRLTGTVIKFVDSENLKNLKNSCMLKGEKKPELAGFYLY